MKGFVHFLGVSNIEDLFQLFSVICVKPVFFNHKFSSASNFLRHYLSMYDCCVYESQAELAWETIFLLCCCCVLPQPFILSFHFVCVAVDAAAEVAKHITNGI